MYERNAIVLDRFFNQMFGYNMKNNIKTNFNDYSELVDSLEKYKNISEEEENIIQEYDSIANKIREIQKTQENLNRKNLKMQEERANIFQSIGDNSGVIQKKLDNINSNIENLNKDIKENSQQFVNVVSEFNQKSSVRTSCGRTRRNLEGEYNKKLNETLDHYQDIDVDIERKAKQFIEKETDLIEKELEEKMKKNGEKEKIPFNTNVLAKAITLSIDIQKRETDILTNIYERTNKLFTEIKNNTIKSDKHKKAIKDAKSKLEFIAAIKEYLVQFLDNERLTAVNGEEEHSNLMKEACKNLDEDIVQINNLYTLLIKEGAKKITKKSYLELYNLDYLKDLEKKAEEFDNQIKKLNLPVTIINPNYWRIEGMKKIYDTFYKCVTENYDRDLSEYMPEEEIEDDDLGDEEEYNEEPEEKQEEKSQEEKSKAKAKTKKDDTRAEIDKKIDKILGLDNNKDEDEDEDEEDENYDNEDFEDEEDDDNEYEEDEDEIEDEEDIDEESEDIEEDDFEDEEDDYDFEEDNEEDEFEEEEDEEDEADEEDDDVSFDIWGNNINKAKKNIRQIQENNEEDDDDFEEEDDDEYEDDDSDFDDDDEYEDEEDDDEEDKKENDEAEEQKDKNNVKQNKNNKNDNKNPNWEDEFINIDKKEKTKKRKGFFDKFKK